MSQKSNWIHALNPLHTGKIFGPYYPIFSLFIGFILFGLIISGFYRPRKFPKLLARPISKLIQIKETIKQVRGEAF
jgi:hypothetical protein